MKNEEYIDNDLDLTAEETESEKENEVSIQDEPIEENDDVIEAPLSLLAEDETSEESVDAVDEKSDTLDDGLNVSESSDEEDEYITDEESVEDENESDEEALEEKNSTDDSDKPRRIDSLFDFIEMFVFTLAAAFIIMSFFFRYSTVNGDSMLNTLEDQDRLLLRSFLYTPKQDDIIVVEDRSSALKEPIVKRVIATEGQRIKITHDGVYVDGELKDEDYVNPCNNCNRTSTSDKYEYSVTPSPMLHAYLTEYVPGSHYEILVPEGQIFVMGDHRDNSTDSRKIGLLHEDAIIGKVVFRFFPFDKFGKIE